MSEHESIPNEVQEYWDKQNGLFARIKEYGGFSGYTGTIEHLSEVFHNENRSVCCMDERTDAGTIRYTGSGILDQARASQRVKEAGATGVYSHAGCGAAALAYERLSDETKETARNNLDPDERFTSSEEYAQWWAKNVAKEADIDYLGHLPVSPNFHIARVVYYDGTGMFDSSRAAQLPSGFVISRRYLDEHYAKEDLKLSVDIAFGHHGFGKDRFTKDAPFILVVIGNPGDERFSLDQLTKEAKEVAKQYAGNVVVDGFIAPIIKGVEVAQEELEPAAA